MPKIAPINFSISDNPYFAKQRAQIRRNLRGDDGALLYPTLKKFEDTGRKTEEKMDEFLSTMIKPSKVNINGLKGVFNCEKIQEDAIRGETLADKPEALRALKEMGIKRVIDLSNESGYRYDCKEAGLEYNGIDSFIVSKEGLINLINTINNGDYYIGCWWGTNTTDQAIVVNQFFNPNNKIVSKTRIERNKDHNYNYCISMMAITAEELTKEDKQALGWTPEFEKKFNERIEKELAELKKRQQFANL